DALSTYVFLHTNVAREANPLLSAAAASSPGLFLFVKLMTFVPAILLAEWYRRINPTFVRRGLRLATAVYLGAYFIFVVPQLLFQSSSKARAALNAGTTSTSSIRFPIPPRHTPAWDFLSRSPHRLPAFLAGVAVHCRRLVSHFG